MRIFTHWVFVILIAIAVITIVYVFIEITKVGAKNTAEVNKNNCAVYGYEEDCKTPLR